MQKDYHVCKEFNSLCFLIFHEKKNSLINIQKYIKRRRLSPQFEVRIHHSVGETFTTDTNAFKYTVTSELMHDQMGVDHTRLLQLVGDDATDEVGLGSTQGSHQIVQLLPVGGRYGGEATTLLATSALAAAAAASVTGLAGMIGENLHQQFVAGFLILVDYRVVQRVLVLLQPAGDVIRYLKSKEILNFLLKNAREFVSL